MTAVYESTDTVTINNDAQSGFGLQALNDLIYMWSVGELKQDFNVDQAQFQQLVSGQRMAINRKNLGKYTNDITYSLAQYADSCFLTRCHSFRCLYWHHPCTWHHGGQYNTSDKMAGRHMMTTIFASSQSAGMSLLQSFSLLFASGQCGEHVQTCCRDWL